MNALNVEIYSDLICPWCYIGKRRMEAGLPKAEAGGFLDSVTGTKEVSEEVNKGLELGLDGVPFFVVNGVPAVAGAQAAEAFLQVFQLALGLDKSSQTI